MTLHRRFIKTARAFWNKVGLIDKTTGRDFTYGRLLIASIILARRFKRNRNAHLGIMLPTGSGCVLAIIASLMARKTPVMINYSTGAAHNCRYAQQKCHFRTIITSSKLCDKLDCERVPGMVYIEDILKGVSKLDKLRAFVAAKLPLPMLLARFGQGDLEDTAVILFTSGSENDPKAVMLAHRNILHNVLNIPKHVDISDRDVFVGNLPYFHVFGLTVTMWLPITMGCTIVSHANPLDYKAIVNSVRDHSVTVMVGTPTFYHGYLKRSEPGDFASLRLAIAGADKLTRQIREEYIQQHGLEVMEGYGATETSPVVSTNTPAFNKPGSIGKPLPGVKVRIIDRETEEVLPPNKEGKIVVKGDLVMKGYYNDLEETSHRIHNGWYETGDMGMMDEDGFLFHRGRLKRFVKIGGEMVSLVKVEGVLEQLLPEGALCCVVDVPNAVKGADIVAAVTTKEVNIRHIKKLMGKDLPSIAIPREFYVLDDLPLMGTGKVNFREVEKLCFDLHQTKKK